MSTAVPFFAFWQTLRDLGYLNSEAGNYRLSFKFLEVGMKVENITEVKRLAFPFMQELAHLYNETVNLARIIGTDIIYVEKINSNSPLRLDLAVGTRVPRALQRLGKSNSCVLNRELKSRRFFKKQN